MTREDKLFKRVHRIQGFLYLLSAAIVIVASLFAFGIHQDQIAISQSHRSLCIFKHNDQQSLKTAVQFLREHPNGTPDFSKAFILHAISQDRLQLNAFRDISCS